MAGSTATKKKFFWVYRILTEQTDEEHPMALNRLAEELAAQGITAERKGLYHDMNELTACGVDVGFIPGAGGGYYIGERPFQLPEVRLLMDAVQSARFITVGKSRELIGKLGTLVSQPQRRELKDQVFLDHRIKCDNEQIYYNIDILGQAIRKQSRVSFQYLRYNARRQMEPRKEGHRYEVTPYRLVWVDDMYYLLCNMAKYDGISHYRLDRMVHVEQLPLPGRPLEEIQGIRQPFNAAEYVKSQFSMFSGREERAQIRFNAALRDVVFDRFGRDVPLVEEGDTLVAVCRVVPGSGLFSWIAMLDGRAQILEPASLRQQMADFLRTQMALYGL